MRSIAMRTSTLIVACLALCIPCVTRATMVVAVRVPDGFVIATDSRLGIMTTEEYCYLSDEMQKLMQAGQKVAVAVSGRGEFVDSDSVTRDISSVVKTLLKDGGIEDSSVVTPEYVVSLLKTRLAELRVNRSDTNKFPCDTTWFVVCGYDSLSTPLLYSFGIPSTKRSTLSEAETDLDVKVIDTTASYCYVAGEQGTYKRLTAGRHIPLDKMTLRIATRYAVFLLQTTIEMQQYDADAAPHVGGPIDVAVVTPNGFVWIQKKPKSVTFEKR